MTPVENLAVQGVALSTAAIARRIHQAFVPLGTLASISIYLEDGEGPRIGVVEDGEYVFAEAGLAANPSREEGSSFSFILESGIRVVVRDADLAPVTARLVGAVLQGSLQALDTEKREELLLEELGANWESLEALYEISTDALRFGDTKDALKRLIQRLTTFQQGLHSALFIRREGIYHPLVSTDQGLRPLALSQLGPVEKAVRAMQVTLVNRPAPTPDGWAYWRNAVSLAAAPFAWEGSVGFVVVWNDEPNSEFDSSVSRMLEAITYQASVMMQGDRLNRKLRESELLAQEVEIASSIQQTLLLANAPKDVPGLQIASCSIASQRIDGDFHDFFQHPNGTIDVLLGDVMGKGVAAALLGAATKSQFLRATANLALRSTGDAPRPASIVTRAASRLSERLIALDRFVTLCYARFDSRTQKLIFVDCGHTSMIRESKSQPECLFLRGEDLPLGVLPDYRCEEHSLDFFPGETYLLYSDGVTETRSPSGELFGPERLAECVQNWSALGPALLVEQIRKEASSFTESDKLSDDFTCIAVRVKILEDATGPRARRSRTFPCSTRSLTQFRSWLCACAELVGDLLAEEDLARLQLACSEAFANCAIHVLEHPCTTPINVETHMFAKHISVEISYPGPEFDPLAVSPPAFDGSRDGGFGIYIVLRSADEASFTRRPDGTNITTLSFLRGCAERSL